MSRAAFVGACYGALHGNSTLDTEEGVPLSWLSLMHDGAPLFHTARQLVDLRTSLAGGPEACLADEFMGA